MMSIEAAKALLRKVKLRCTSARTAILQCLANTGTPLSPAEVADHLQGFGFDKSTIYRSLTEFNEVGLVTRLDLGDSIRRFELIALDSEATEHPHFMCVLCGKVICLDDFSVDIAPTNASTQSPGEIYQVLLRGQCVACG